MNEMVRMMKSVLATIEAGGFAPDDFLPNISGGRNARRILVRNFLRKKLAPVFTAEEQQRRQIRNSNLEIRNKSEARNSKEEETTKEESLPAPVAAAVSVVSNFEFRDCFGFRNSDFEFAADVGETPKEVIEPEEHQGVTDSPCCRKSAQNRAKTCRNRAKPTRNFAKSRKTLQNVSKFCSPYESDHATHVRASAASRSPPFPCDPRISPGSS